MVIVEFHHERTLSCVSDGFKMQNKDTYHSGIKCNFGRHACVGSNIPMAFVELKLSVVGGGILSARDADEFFPRAVSVNLALRIILRSVIGHLAGVRTIHTTTYTSLLCRHFLRAAEI